MPTERRPPDEQEIATMHRILLKVAAHELPTAEELAFLREIKIEVLRRRARLDRVVQVLEARKPRVSGAFESRGAEI